MQTNNLYNREQLEELLADYALGNLPTEQAEVVRQSLQQFPELQQEVESISTVFTKIDKQKITSTIDYQARNLSVHVNQKIATQPKRSFSSILFGRVVPIALSVTAVILVIRFTTESTNHIASIDEDISQALMHDASVMQTVQNGIAEPSLGAPTAEATSVLSDTAHLSDNLDELLAESIISSTSDQPDPDFIETERIQLQNKADIDDIEKMIQEVSDDAG